MIICMTHIYWASNIHHGAICNIIALRMYDDYLLASKGNLNCTTWTRERVNLRWNWRIDDFKHPRRNIVLCHWRSKQSGITCFTWMDIWSPPLEGHYYWNTAWQKWCHPELRWAKIQVGIWIATTHWWTQKEDAKEPTKSVVEHCRLKLTLWIIVSPITDVTRDVDLR